MEDFMQEIIKTKICNTCKIEKDLDRFHKDNSSKSGVQTKCKQCKKEYQQENSDYTSIRQKNYRQNNYEATIEYRKTYYQANRETLAEQRKVYYQANREAIAKQTKTYQEANREKLVKHKKAYNQANAEKNAKQVKAYAQTPIGKASRTNARHKRRTITKQGDVTAQQLLELTANAKNCYWRNASLKNKKVHIDHYIPLAREGNHTLSNLVVSCSKCNISKHAKDPIEFAQSIGKLF